MNALSLNEKLNLIVDLCEKHQITAYEIAKATGLSASGVQKILNNEIRKPHNKTLNSIREFVESKIVNSDPYEPPASGGSSEIKKLVTEILDNETALMADPLFKLFIEVK